MYQLNGSVKPPAIGFVEDIYTGKEFFVHHTDIQVSDGFRYLREGEYVVESEEAMEGDKVKVAQIRAPMEGGKLMCEVERRTRRTRQEASGDETTTEA